MSKVTIIYEEQDRVTAAAIVGDLDAAGATVEELPVSSDSPHLASCNSGATFIVLLSKSSSISDSVASIVEQVTNAGARIVPAYIEKAALSERIRLSLLDTLTLNLYENPKDGMIGLLQAVQLPVSDDIAAKQFKFVRLTQTDWDLLLEKLRIIVSLSIRLSALIAGGFIGYRFGSEYGGRFAGEIGKDVGGGLGILVGVFAGIYIIEKLALIVTFGWEILRMLFEERKSTAKAPARKSRMRH